MSFSDLVLEFHKKQSYAIDADLKSSSDSNFDGPLMTVGLALRNLTDSVKEPGKLASGRLNDHRLYRLWLMLEELSEGAIAMAKSDPVEFADFLADMLYIVIGTAITYGIPIEDVFKEVHRSNMTKGHASKDHPNYKGIGYSKPDIASILERKDQL